MSNTFDLDFIKNMPKPKIHFCSWDVNLFFIFFCISFYKSLFIRICKIYILCYQNSIKIYS